MPTYQEQMQQIERRRRMAEALVGNASSQQGQMVGGHYVAPSTVGNVANIASVLLGGRAIRQADRDQEGAQSAERQRIRQALERMTNPGGIIDESGAVPAMDPQRSAALDMVGSLPVESQQQVLANQSLKQLFPPSEDAKQPSSVLEYEYARKNGFKGSFQEWVVAGGQSSRPSAVQEWEFYSQLPQDMQQRYLEMKRTPNMFVKDVNAVPTLIHPSVGAGTSTQPLSTSGSENAAANERKRQEAEGSALGKAQGEIAGGIQTKGANAEGTTSLLDEADPLIDSATGSAGGALIDAGAGAFGKSTGGAQSIARLKVISAALIQNMPRLEGPQSDADRALYIEAAGQIGDPTVPRETKRAALQTVRRIQYKYKQRAADAGAPPATGVPSAGPARISSDAEFDALPSGAEFIAPDGSHRRKP